MKGTGVLRRACQGFLLSFVMLMASPCQSATVLFNETFENITGFPTCSYCDPQLFGVPRQAPAGTNIGNSDEDWVGARFEQPNGGAIHQDVGAQKFGGGTNNTKVGLVEDDAGLMFELNTTGFSNISLSFDWRTFSVTNDRFVAGYFVGDLNSIVPPGRIDSTNDTMDLRNASHGGQDGIWNWDPINNQNGSPSGNTGDWVEILRGKDSSWHSENFVIPALANQQSVWIAFWLDNGENDFGKFDNVVVMGDAVVPVPAAFWLFGSGLLGLVAVARRRQSQKPG